MVGLLSAEVGCDTRALLTEILQIFSGVLIYSSNILLQVAELKANLLRLIYLLGVGCLYSLDDLQLLLPDPIYLVHQLRELQPQLLYL